MSRTKNTHITYCSFPPPVPSHKYYTCYKKEICCNQGCCINGPFQIYQVWYYWLLFLVIFAIISGGSWLCKRPRSRQRRPAETLTHSSCSYAVPHCSRRRCAANLDSRAPVTRSNDDRSLAEYDDDIILDQLYVSFRNRGALGDPPSYSSVLKRDCSNKPPKFCPLYAYSGPSSLADPPPAYSSMYILTPGPGVPPIQQPPCLLNTNVISDESSVPCGGNVSHTKVHPEENVVVNTDGKESHGDGSAINTTMTNVANGNGSKYLNSSANNNISTPSTSTDGTIIINQPQETQEGRDNQIDPNGKQEDV